jgi:hypothetical protein
VLTGETLFGRADDYQWLGRPGCAISGTTGPDVTYQATIPAGQRLTVTATPSNSSLELSIQFSTTCPAGTMNTCLGGGNTASTGLPERQSLDNGGTSPLTVFVVIDTNTAPAGFDLAFALAPLSPDTCGGALPASGTQTDHFDGFSNDYVVGAGCAAGTSGPDRAYLATVPAGSRLTASVSAPDFRPTINLTTGSCTTNLQCVAGTQAPADGGVGTAIWDNVGANSEAVYLVVDTNVFAPTGFFTLNTSVAPVTLPTSDTCGTTAPAITTDTMLTAQSFTTFGNHFNTATVNQGCDFLNGPDRVYAVTIPSQSRLQVNATSAGPDLSISVVDGSAAACVAKPVVCVASADSLGSGTEYETTRTDNATNSPKTVFVIIDRTNPSTPPATDAFDLAVSLSPLPPFVAGGATCAAPAAIGANTTINSTTTGGVNTFEMDARNGCRVSSSAPDKVFTTTIPAGSKLSVQLDAQFNGVLNIVGAPASNCGAVLGWDMVCLSVESRDGFATVRNPTGVPLQVFLIVDGRTATAGGSFDLTTRTAPLPYIETAIAPACTVTTGATVLLGPATTPVFSDDAVSTTVALPFSFSLAGAATTHFAVSTNGYAQLFASVSGRIVSKYDNDPIPTVDEPNGLIAPFWEDIYHVSNGATSLVQTLVTGTAPNRTLTIEWAQVSLQLLAARGAVLTFQAQLHESTNVVEFHYCTLNANGGGTQLETGSSATVGLENLTGTDGVQHSYNRVNAVSTATALRFTPNP